MPLEKSPQTVICVPGPWQSQTELAAQIAKLSGGYVLRDTFLINEQMEVSLELEICPHDSRMPSAFCAAGPHWKDTLEMTRIKDHRLVAYLVGKGGSRERADIFMKATAALIHSGGLGVKIESSGIAHSPVDWLRLVDGILAAHRAFVVYVTDEQTFSCGMHNLGLRDAIIEAKHSTDPVELLRVFTQYLYIENPVIRADHTFSAVQGAPHYRLTEEAEPPYSGDDLFHNPYGMWRLNPD